MAVSAACGRLWLFVAFAACIACVAEAEERRDIVFDCPCTAEWVADEDGGQGTLTLSGGIRSLRGTKSGDIRIAHKWNGQLVLSERLEAFDRLRDDWTLEGATPQAGAVVELALEEAIGTAPQGETEWSIHEILALWPVLSENDPGRIHFIDILTDSDGDGFGDVNERLAKTSWQDAESQPGDSTIDVLAFYSPEFAQSEGGYPYTKLLHELTVADAVFADSGTGIRLRIVGMRETELNDGGWLASDTRAELMESYGADVSIQVGGPCNCADIGAWTSSKWEDAEAAVWGGMGSALVTAHELGHVMGLAHSARQGEAYGAFRWSRGHYLTPRGTVYGAASATGYGTLMTYGDTRWSGIFSSPITDCRGVPCGVSAGEIDGADAAKTLDVLRFQIAAHREPSPDSDGDGFVDAADALPRDPTDWFDADRDGIGDNADLDDDNDGTPDVNDPFPTDPGEWADADLDGIGDNTDDEVTNASPFRDPALRTAVEYALGKSAGAVITKAELAQLTDLHAAWEGIQSLDGIEQATRLEQLILADNDIVDLGPLSGLASLKTLDLKDNKVVDLSPLSGLSALERLVLSGNPVNDISPLAALERCVDLELDDTNVSFEDVRALPYFGRLRGLGVAGLGITDTSMLAGLPLRSLSLARNPLSDAAPLSRLTSLVRLDLSNTRLRQIAPLVELEGLQWLNLSGNGITDLGALSQLVSLGQLRLADNRIADLTALKGLVKLWSLDIDRNDVSSLDPLFGLQELAKLQAADNRITSVAALSGMKQLQEVGLANNAITDIAAFAGKTSMRSLELSRNSVTDLAPLSDMVNLWSLLLDHNAISDITPIAGLPTLNNLSLNRNRITDVAPLAQKGALQWVDLSDNIISDIAPLVDQSIFGGEAFSGAFLKLTGNPLDDASRDDHIADLRALGIEVDFIGPGQPNEVTDPTLRTQVSETLASGVVHVDDRSGLPFEFLTELHLMGRGVSSLAGLDAARALDTLYAASNEIGDLSPLSQLGELRQLDLRDNRITDLSPLVGNAGLSTGDWLALDGNPLSEQSLNEHVPQLRARGVDVSVGRVVLMLNSGGTAQRFDTAGYFKALLGDEVEWRVTVDAPLVSARLSSGVLILTPGRTVGTAIVKLTAWGSEGGQETLEFEARIRAPLRAPFVASAYDTARQELIRVVNHSAQAGVAEITAVDDMGARHEGLKLALGVGKSAELRLADIESGNPAIGLTGRASGATGDWRLEFASTLDLEVLTYARTPEGPLRTMHSVAKSVEGAWVVPTFYPDGNSDQVSSLRVSNLGDSPADVAIIGVDELGDSPDQPVQVNIPPRATVTLSAKELEAGSARTQANLGDGQGIWRLMLASEADLAVASLLANTQGHLSNLSSAPVAPDRQGVHRVPLLPTAKERQAFVRVVNRSDQSGLVQIDSRDDTGRRYETLTLALEAGKARHISSEDLLKGNADKGFTGSIGRVSGDLWLTLQSEIELEVTAYVAASDGLLDVMHDTVPRNGRRYHVGMFNPSSNTEQVSKLRIVNPGTRPALVSIAGVDDEGASANEVVQTLIDAGTARTITSAELQERAYGLEGRLGHGNGKWRLWIDCEQPVLVMNLLESPTGDLVNLSATAIR